MKWIGLTGGLGSGKSTMAEMLRRRGFVVVDADAMARLAVRPGSKTLEQIKSRFGAEMLKADGSLDRAALAEVVFSDAENLSTLEAIIHPEVKRLTLDERHKAESSGAKMAFYDVPLLFEKNMEDQFDAIIVVTADENLCIERAMSRDGFSREMAMSRIKAQLPLEQKVRRASHVITNNGSFVALEKQVDELLRKMNQ